MALEIEKEEKSKAEQKDLERAEQTESRPRYVPPADIYEKEDGLVLLLDMPGVAEKDVEVKLEDGVLTIWGRVEDSAPGDRRALLREYGVGDYQRAFTVNEAVDVNAIAAELHNGVLRVFLPRAEEARPRKIPVKTV
jgi:HSP20 family molecular chaperone IbpA